VRARLLKVSDVGEHKVVLHDRAEIQRSAGNQWSDRPENDFWMGGHTLGPTSLLPFDHDFFPRMPSRPNAEQ
jgi:hypothetical protein